VQVRANEVLAGKYRITRMLGEGGMGIVVEAVHLGLGHRVALKLLRSELVRAEHRERFFREARAAGSLRSEHVVAIKDVDTLPDGTPFLVMEYLEGADLGRVVHERGPLPPEEATDYVLQACHALAEAHSRGIVHRDLKPPNLFLTRRLDGAPLVKVLDFGIAKIADGEMARELTATSQYMGSPSYMSPEQVRSAKRVDTRTDIWALGVILYELLTGCPPFDGETAGDVFVKISTEPPRPFAPPMPMPLLEAIVLRCLEKDPERRYRDVAELAAALLPYAGVNGRARAEAVARVAGRELPVISEPLPVAASGPMRHAASGPTHRAASGPTQHAATGPTHHAASGPPVPAAANLSAAVTTLGLGAGQSQVLPGRRRRGGVIAAVAVVIVAGVATASYLTLAPGSSATSPAATAPAPAAAPTAQPATATQPTAVRGAPPAPPAPAGGPAPAAPPTSVATPPPAPVEPGATPPTAGSAEPAAAAPPPGSVESPTPEPPRKVRKPGRRGAKPDPNDGDFIEDRR
jgi:tRNA A-37 threonylcarbamoyl transferase component Bud32